MAFPFASRAVAISVRACCPSAAAVRAPRILISERLGSSGVGRNVTVPPTSVTFPTRSRSEICFACAVEEASVNATCPVASVFWVVEG